VAIRRQARLYEAGRTADRTGFVPAHSRSIAGTGVESRVNVNRSRAGPQNFGNRSCVHPDTTPMVLPARSTNV
jgi:hypothetical protein